MGSVWYGNNGTVSLLAIQWIGIFPIIGKLDYDIATSDI
jgi:hypothetical protein